MNWVFIIDAISDTLMPVVSLATGIINKTYKETRNLPILFFLAFAVIIFAISNYLADRGINNLFLYNFFGFFETLFVFVYLFSKLKIRSLKILSLVTLCVCLFLILVKILKSELNFNDFT